MDSKSSLPQTVFKTGKQIPRFPVFLFYNLNKILDLNWSEGPEFNMIWKLP